MSERLTRKQEARYPNLASSGYRKTSDSDPRYNCVSWAADWETSRWWEPFSKGKAGRHWPEGVPESYYVESYVRAFGTRGYVVCESHELEAGFEKIALFQDEIMDLFSHVAKQLPDGRWASKLGREDDIVHDSIDAFQGCPKYGRPTRFMKRPLRPVALPPNLLGA